MALINASGVFNANVYINGISLLGRAEEIELAWPKAKMVDHKSLGLMGTVEIPVGIDKLEAKFKWMSVFSEVLAVMGIFQSNVFTILASIEQFTSSGRIAQLPFVGTMVGQFKDGGPLNFKQHERVDFPSTLVVYSCSYIIAGVTVLAYDAFSNIYLVNGVDQNAQFRANIGAS